MVLAANLSTLLGLSAAPGTPSSTRVAWHFTSDLRQRLGRAENRLASAIASDTANRDAFVEARTQLQAADDSVTTEDLARRVATFNRIVRKRDELKAQETTADRELAALLPALNQQNLMTTIVAQLNPYSLTMSGAKRISVRPTRRGKVFFHFTDDRGRNDDVMTINAKGSTGNLDRRSSIVGNDQQAAFDSYAQADKQAYRRLITFQNLLLLSREPTLLPDGTRNQVSITLSSAVFPVPIEMRGHFARQMEIVMEGKDPLRGMYSFEFVVKETSPDPMELLDVIAEAVQTLTFSSAGVSQDARIATEGT